MPHPASVARNELGFSHHARHVAYFSAPRFVSGDWITDLKVVEIDRGANSTTNGVGKKDKDTVACKDGLTGVSSPLADGPPASLVPGYSEGLVKMFCPRLPRRCNYTHLILWLARSR